MSNALQDITIDEGLDLDIQAEYVGKVLIISLSGKFFLGNINEVEEFWQEQVNKQPSVIAIDCKNLDFIS